MHIKCEWFSGNTPNFNVALSSSEQKEPFIVIKGCRIANGKNGEFVSWPSRKIEEGKYWNHVYASEGFNVAVLEAAKAAMPKQDTRTHSERKRAVSDDDFSPPF